MNTPFAIRTIILAGSLLLQLSTLCFQSRGAAGDVDLSFDPGSGVNRPVNAVVAQPDGKVLISGQFTTVNGTNRNGVARLNANGNLDSSFTPGLGTGVVSTIALQSDGKVLVGGQAVSQSYYCGYCNFSNGYVLNRLNASGSLDGSFVSEIPIPVLYPAGCPTDRQCYDFTYVTSLAVQPDGKVLVGGHSFHFVVLEEGQIQDEINDLFIMRLNTNGSSDTSFEPAIEHRAYDGSDTPLALAVQPDGKVVVGGKFLSINGTNRNGIARLNANGTLDNSFNPSTGGYPIALQPDGKILIRGYARLNASGSLDGSFNSNLGVVGYEETAVNSLALQSDGKVLVAGTGVHYYNCDADGNCDALYSHFVTRLNTNGSLDNTFNPVTGTNGPVRSIALQSDGKALIGGDFTIVNGVVRSRIARLYGDFAAPTLNIARSNAFVIVSWPVSALNFQLQENTNLSLPNSWSLVTQPAVSNTGQISVTVPKTVGRTFFRLKSQ